MDFRAFDRLANAAALSVFGASITYTASGTSTAIIGTFNAAAEVIAISEEGAHVVTTVPVAMIRIADLPAKPRNGDVLVIAGEGSFRVAGAPEDDGFGMYRLKLHEA